MKKKHNSFYGVIMKRLLVIAFVFSLVSFSAKAESEADCAIWICLPGGFPSGCEAAYREYKGRIKHGRPPLPKLSSCTTGPNGEKIDGQYELGYERYEFCKAGFFLKDSPDQDRYGTALCVKNECRNGSIDGGGGGGIGSCESYQAIKRQKQNYVKMWVNGDYLGQFFY